MVLWLCVQLRKSTSIYMAVVVFLCGSALDLGSTESEITSVISVRVGKCRRVVNGEKLGWGCLALHCFGNSLPVFRQDQPDTDVN